MMEVSGFGESAARVELDSVIFAFDDFLVELSRYRVVWRWIGKSLSS